MIRPRVSGLVIDEKILLAAALLPETGFTAEELVVKSHKQFPGNFSLMGFPEYPDSNKVLTQITTAGRGLQKRGWLEKIGTKRYHLTGEGRRRLASLERNEDQIGIRADDRDVANLLQHWLRSEAYQKFRAGKQDDIGERQALAHWRLTSGATAARTHRLLAVAESASSLLEANTQTSQSTQPRHDLLIQPAEAQRLVDLHVSLKKKFKDALEYLSSQRR